MLMFGGPVFVCAAFMMASGISAVQESGTSPPGYGSGRQKQMPPDAPEQIRELASRYRTLETLLRARAQAEDDLLEQLRSNHTGGWRKCPKCEESVRARRDDYLRKADGLLKRAAKLELNLARGTTRTEAAGPPSPNTAGFSDKEQRPPEKTLQPEPKAKGLPKMRDK
jgi:hypothetical protein